MAGSRIMFVSSNGTGLGHLTRSMAIARRLDREIEPLFVTLSRAAPVVREMGFPVEYMASHNSPTVGSDLRWSRRMTARLRTAIAEARPDLLVFDGVLPYDPLLAAMKRVPATVWCRRGLWQPGASTAPLTRSDLFDAILEPGDFAADADAGPTSTRHDEVHDVPPIVFLDDTELLPRAEAERELGLEPGKPTILVQLGQGPEVAAATTRCLRTLAGADGVQVAAASSGIAGLLDVPEGIVHLRSTYPMSRYYAAFDGAVSAVGYNAFHEMVAFGIPALFVPMRRETDDQAARARYAETAGVGLAVDGPEDERIEDRLGELLDAGRRVAMREKLEELRPDNGAAQAAEWLQHLAEGAGGRDEKTYEQGLRGGFSPRPMDGEGSSRPAPRRPTRFGSPSRAWVFVRTIPRTVWRLIGQTLILPRPTTLILAFGADEAAIRNAVNRVQEPPERILLVTDSLAIGEVWRAGTGVEHVPASGERQVELASIDYSEFRRRHLGLILAGRPRFRKALPAGDVPPDLLDAATASPRRRARLLS